MGTTIRDLIWHAADEVTDEHCVGGEGCPGHLIAEAVETALSRAGWVVVCNECGHVPDTDVPILHRRAVPSGMASEDAEVVCLWPCGHAVERGRPCRCQPEPSEPF